MNITVIVCTYNRSRMLPRALESLARSCVSPSVQWEVLVVDNNSRDQTPKVVAEFMLRYPGRFRYLFEQQPGKSYALNAGIREASGEIVAFADDDVVVDEEWLERLAKPLLDGSWIGAGGRILPDWQHDPPRWLILEGRYALAPLAAFDLGMAAGELHEPPFGTSMAFRKDAFIKYGGFRTDLGPHPGSQIRSEDTEFGRRVLAAGERLWYEPSAVVYHPVPADRLRRSYFLEWWFDKGRAEIREFGLRPDVRRTASGVPLYLIRTLIKQLACWVVAIEPKTRFARKTAVWQKAGQIVEARRYTSGPASVPVTEAEPQLSRRT
jgi:glycosyltransferase involved in cell wall biosynthesis